MSEEGSVDELKSLKRKAHTILIIPDGPVRREIIEIARTEKQREPAFFQAGELALQVDRRFSYAYSVGLAASWLVLLRKKFGLAVFDEVVKPEEDEWGG